MVLSIQLQAQLDVLMVMYDFKMVQLSRVGVWKSVLQDSGGQFVMISGMIEMQLSSAGSLDTMTLVISLSALGIV